MFNHSGGARVELSGSTGSLFCPVCFQPASIVDGSYTTDQNDNLRAELRLTKEQAETLRQLFRQIDRVAQASRLTDEEARTRIDDLLDQVSAAGQPAIADEYRKRIDPADRSSWSLGAKAVVVAIFAAMGIVNTVADFSDRVQSAWDYFMASTVTGGVVEIHDPEPVHGWTLPDDNA